jgi:uncharacterized DUF497 family protein
LKISDFEWDEGNVIHLELGHGIEPEEVEEVFAQAPLFRRTKKGHYVALGPTGGGRYLTIVFELKKQGVIRPITGWDMRKAEIQYYRRQKGSQQ